MKAVLPSKEALALCFDKSKSMRLAEQHEIPHPASWLVTDMDQEARLPDRYPCVIKPANETEAKSVFYANGRKEREKAVVDLLTSVLPEHSNGVLVQEMVIGKGRGFFAVYDRGRPISVFMHERIREYPPSGGPSTAAMAIYDPVLVDYSTRLLRTLEWHGPVMVEYKYDSGSGRYNLIEINPKFWGSLELGLSAGVNFAHVLVRIFLGEGDLLQYSDRYNRSAHFFWPLDNDLKCIIETRQFRRVGDYFRRDASTNLLQSLRVDLLKSALLLRDLLRR
jgi:predicted ATP-grasp superfamily ATP-dependent carboligase